MEQDDLIGALVDMMNSCTVPRRHGRITRGRPPRRVWPRPGVLSSTVAPIVEV